MSILIACDQSRWNRVGTESEQSRRFAKSGTMSEGSVGELTTNEIEELQAVVRRLEDESAITRLILSYGPAADGRLASFAGSLWLEDGVYDWDADGSPHEGSAGVEAASGVTALCPEVSTPNCGRTGSPAWRRSTMSTSIPSGHAFSKASRCATSPRPRM